MTEGTAAHPQAGSAVVTTRLYDGGVLVAADFPVDHLAGHLRDPDRVIWVDLYRPTEEDLVEVCRELGLDPPVLARSFALCAPSTSLGVAWSDVPPD